MAHGPSPTPARRTRRRKHHSKRLEQPRPYHVGIVAFLTYLAAGLPMASLFKVYTYILCIAYPPALSSSPVSIRGLPPAPSLPFPDPQCPLNPRIASTTSSYAAIVTTLGSILALASLDSASRLTRRFGRKPLMLLMHLLLILGYTTIRFGTALSQSAAPALPGSDQKKRVSPGTAIPGLVLVMIGAVLAETAQGAPLRIALQNYIVDTVPPEEQDDDDDEDEGEGEDGAEGNEGDHGSPPSTGGSRASALSFLEGVGQLGAFPSSTLGGLLAAYTAAFFAPFYAAILCVGLAFAWALFGVPESKLDRQHIGIIDGFDPSSRAEGDVGSTSEHGTSEVSDQPEEQRLRQERQRVPRKRSIKDRLRRLLAITNFLRPLAVFAPVRAKEAASNTATSSHSSDFRLPILAILILFEETFQAFLIPAFLLYCSDVFRYNQLQEGYLVSIMQGTRAIWLALVFPRVLGWARDAVSRRAEAKHGKRQQSISSRSEGPASETSPLLHARSRDGEASEHHQLEEVKAMARSRLDMTVLLLSYAGSVLAFVLLASSATASPSSSSPSLLGRDDEGQPTSAWWILISGLVLLQLSSGSAWIRTALVVNAASSLAARRRLASTQAGRERHQDGQQRTQGSQAGSAFSSSHHDGSQLTVDEEGVVSTSTAESLALAANQIVITFTTALMPIVTSLVYARGLQAKPSPYPQAVWVFKAAVAGASAIVGLVLAWEGERVHRRERRRAALS